MIEKGNVIGGWQVEHVGEIKVRANTKDNDSPVYTQQVVQLLRVYGKNEREQRLIGPGPNGKYAYVKNDDGNFPEAYRESRKRRSFKLPLDAIDADHILPGVNEELKQIAV